MKSEGVEEKKEKVQVKHWRRPDPYRIDNPEPDTAYALISTDETQLNAALSVGWEPIKARDYPNLFNGGGFAGKDGFYRYRELIWCQIPKNVMDERAAYYARLTDERSRQVAENYLQSKKGLGVEINLQEEKI